MLSYSAPLQDMQFVLNDFLDSEQHYSSLSGCELVTTELLDAILDNAARFAENVVAPTFQSGDEHGCTFDQGVVTTPPGFADAFHQCGQGGWQALTVPAAEGGQGLPGSVGMYVTELIGSANWAWSMYGGLSGAPVSCLINGGTAELKQRFLPKLLTGEWAGTMCLTEAHCGSDVGLLRTRASANADGTWTITGTKIFISGGEQDITDNIVHAILARVEGAPAGTAGISLFLVPKIWVNEDGSLGESNRVSCGSIEHKMGLKGSATCVMNYDGARGFMLGQENAGLKVMFKLMNTARIGTALQGLTMSERSYQGARTYAKDRLQMRALTGAKNPDGPADPIIVHPDVRRMLMTQRALSEGARAFLYWLAQLSDLVTQGDKQQAEEASALLELLTPIAKGFCTETAQEVSYLGMQVFGGHGYISEHGMEQVARDNRIATVYEGTTGIQSLDLIGRKVMGSGGQLLRNFTKIIHRFCQEQQHNHDMAVFIPRLQELNGQWGQLTQELGEGAVENPDVIGTASLDYMMYSGYVAFAYIWARIALVSQNKLAAGAGGADFYRAKCTTARFYFERLLPRTRALAESMLADPESIMALSEDAF